MYGQSESNGLLCHSVTHIYCHNRFVYLSFLTSFYGEQEIRSVERGYLSHCFKSRSRNIGHAPFWGHSSSTVYYFQQWI